MITAQRPLLEVIALDAADAEAAQAGGADRLELVADMTADGLSPSPATVRSVLGATDLPVRVMLRDSAGFAAADLPALCRRVARLREAGATQFVLGFLTPAGKVDVHTVRTLLAEIEGCHWTFHRALDFSADVEDTWRVVSGLGCDAVLSAGSRIGVAHGFSLLGRLADRQHRDGITLLVGGGLRREHIMPLQDAGVHCFHVGGAVRSGGWDTPVSAEIVRDWSELVMAKV